MPLRAELGAAANGTPTGATTPSQSNALKIRLGDESKATVEANSFVKGYAITVTDAGGSPVADAAVAIRLPEDGATGYFVNGEHSAVAYTDSSGVARFPQVNWGATAGVVSIRVTAVKGELHAGVLIEQTVVTQPATTPVPNAAVKAIPNPQPGLPLPDSAAAAPTAPGAAARKQPGTPTSIAAVHSGATPELGATETTASAEPNVSVVNTASSGANSHGSNKKWIILAALAAGAGAGIAIALGSHGGAAAATTASPTTSIGTPTVSVGH
jgi:hypothetical protein